MVQKNNILKTIKKYNLDNIFLMGEKMIQVIYLMGNQY